MKIRVKLGGIKFLSLKQDKCDRIVINAYINT